MTRPAKLVQEKVENSAWRSRFGRSGRRFMTSTDSRNDLKQTARCLLLLRKRERPPPKRAMERKRENRVTRLRELGTLAHLLV
jgi:hypothetical protein